MGTYSSGKKKKYVFPCSSGGRARNSNRSEAHLPPLKFRGLSEEEYNRIDWSKTDEDSDSKR